MKRKDYLKIGLIFCLSLGLGVYARSSPKVHGIKGTVLQVDDGQVLISKRLDLTESELQMSVEQWLQGNYELLITGSASGMEVGQEIKAVIHQIDDSNYPIQATLKKFRLLK